MYFKGNVQTEFKSTPASKQPRVRVTVSDRVEDLEKLGHSICDNNGFYRCKFCFRGARKTGLVRCIARGECEHSEVTQLRPEVEEPEAYQRRIRELSRFIFSIPEEEVLAAETPPDPSGVTRESGPEAKRQRFTETEELAGRPEGFWATPPPLLCGEQQSLVDANKAAALRRR